MTTTPNMLLGKPTVAGDVDAWGTELNAIFDLIDTHDHTTGKGVLVPVAGLNWNADLSASSAGLFYSLRDLKALDFQPQTAASVSSYASALFANADDSNNLYFRNSSGVNVKITSGSTLNVSIVGGIGGDYSSVGALLSFDDATDSYWLQQQGSPRPWAGLRVGNVDIYQQAASITNRVRLQSPNALAASYAMTWFTAMPASQVIAQIDNTGQWTASNTIPGAVSMSSTLGVTGATTLTGGIANNVTLTNGATLAAGKTLDTTAGTLSAGTTNATTVTASVDYKYSGTWTLIVPVCDTKISATSYGTDYSNIALGTSTTNNIYPLTALRQGDRIKTVRLYLQKTANTSTVTLYLKKAADSGGVVSVITSTTNSSNPGFTTMTLSAVNYTCVTNESYYVNVTGGGISGDILYRVEVDIDRP